METEFQNAVGKSVGEVLQDINSFLAKPYWIEREQPIDLCTLLPDLNMPRQFAFALLSEAELQGWEPSRAEAFFRRACEGALGSEETDAFCKAFWEKGAAYTALDASFGNRFRLLDGSYWATALAIGIDSGKIGEVAHYLRLFTICLMEFSYMEDRNPKETYAWGYYRAFKGMLDELTEETKPEPQALKIRAVGGSTGKREGERFSLSLGVDVENPNPDRAATDVAITVELKDRLGKVIAKINDRIACIGPGKIFHYGVTRTILGSPIASISAVATPAGFAPGEQYEESRITVQGLRLRRKGNNVTLAGELASERNTDLVISTLRYQFISGENKILGGGGEWTLAPIPAGKRLPLEISVPFFPQKTAKIVYSIDVGIKK